MFLSCSQNRFAQLPDTGFIKHYEPSDHKRVPFASYWVDRDEDMDKAAVGETHIDIYFAPLRTAYLYDDPQVPLTRWDYEEILKLCDYYDKTMHDAMEKLSKDPRNGFNLVDKPGPGICVVESALLRLKPTRTGRNAAVKAATTGLSLMTGMLLSLTVNMAVSSREDRGYLSIGWRVYDGDGHNLVMEMADWREGSKTIVGMAAGDIKDYEHFAYHRRTIDDWVNEWTQLLSTRKTFTIKEKFMHLW